MNRNNLQKNRGEKSAHSSLFLKPALETSYPLSGIEDKTAVHQKKRGLSVPGVVMT